MLSYFILAALHNEVQWEHFRWAFWENGGEVEEALR